MKALLDTHVWLWWYADPERLGPKTLNLFSQPETDVFLSAASIWEIAIKYKLGKLRMEHPPQKVLPVELRQDNIACLPIAMHHALLAGSLPPHHQDPFDRMIIAQAQSEKMILVTLDPAMKLYDGFHLQWATE